MAVVAVGLEEYFRSYDRVTQEREIDKLKRAVRRTALENCLSYTAKSECNGFQRIRRCRQALEALDRRGWQRSFHQRMFHDNFIRACARIFWKREPHGVFAKDHQKILEVHGWDHLSQEVLVSTPRRFGKTISVSMFAAAMLYSCPNLEMSIYSTCKASRPAKDWFFIVLATADTPGLWAQRISQKLLRNIQRFLELIYIELDCPHMKEIRINMEEIVLQGTECEQDIRMVNSYPSKVDAPCSTKRQCSSRTVSSLHSSARAEHRSNRPCSIFSDESCSASMASRWKRRSDLKPDAISCTSLRNEPLGMANSRRGLRLVMVGLTTHAASAGSLVSHGLLVGGMWLLHDPARAAALRWFKRFFCFYLPAPPWNPSSASASLRFLTTVSSRMGASATSAQSTTLRPSSRA